MLTGEPYTIPMHGVECGRCGQPALRTVVHGRHRVTIHLDSRVADCPAPNPPMEVTR